MFKVHSLGIEWEHFLTRFVGSWSPIITNNFDYDNEKPIPQKAVPIVSRKTIRPHRPHSNVSRILHWSRLEPEFSCSHPKPCRLANLLFACLKLVPGLATANLVQYFHILRVRNSEWILKLAIFSYTIY